MDYKLKFFQIYPGIFNMKIKYLLTALFIVTNLTFAQNIDHRSYHPLSEKFSLSIDGGITLSRTDFKNNGIDYLTRASFDYYVPSLSFGVFGFKVFGGAGYLTGDGYPSSSPEFSSTENFRSLIYNFGGGMTFNVAVSESFIPFIFGGISYFYYEPKNKDGNELIPSIGAFSPHEMILTGETGFKVLFSDNFGMNIAAGIDYVNSDRLDGYKLGTDNDIYFHALAGLTYYFGGIKDSDQDGVRDRDDQCPDTPPMVTVDKHGCPVDSDKDGVPDYMDKCPTTPRNVSVDSDGCPLDVDGDRVPDYMDLCKDTPLGVAVDSRGCPLDSDDDGVPDFKDLCANTPVGTEVNKWGCPIDEEVFEPITKTEFVLPGGINFESGKSDLLPSAYSELDKVLKVLKDYPETKWKIEGHTDNTGSQKLNKDLSTNRAKSVYNYFASSGISSSRLSYIGYGPDYPIADNITETGKALNRRVAIILVSDNETEAKNITAPKEQRAYNVTAERNVGKMIFTDGYLYCVQVSSWRVRAKAENEARRLESDGYNAFIVIAELAELDGTWYRVRVGYYNTFDEANRIRERVK